MRVAVLVAVAGCTYQPGSFRYTNLHFPGQHATVGCLDLAIERRADYDGHAVLGYEFANRCDHATTVDLAHAQVVGRTLDGAELSMVAHDPNGELRPIALDGRLTGAEAIAYATSARRPLGEVCVDAASIAGTDSAQWICFASQEVIR